MLHLTVEFPVNIHTKKPKVSSISLSLLRTKSAVTQKHILADNVIPLLDLVTYIKCLVWQEVINW